MSLDLILRHTHGCLHCSSDEGKTYEFKLGKKEQRHRKIFLIFLAIVFLVAIFKIPPIHYIKSPQQNHTNLSKVDSTVDNKTHTFGQYRRYAISIINAIYLLICGLLVFIFSILLKNEKRAENDQSPIGQQTADNQQRAENNDNNQLGIAVPYFS